MESVTGIGGFFFRARDKKALAQWYRDCLGITLTPQKQDDPVWLQEAGPTVFEPFPENTEYFGDLKQAWMLNFRVIDLDAMAAQLKAAGVTFAMEPSDSPIGKFARIHDPEGNPIELWEAPPPGSAE